METIIAKIIAKVEIDFNGRKRIIEMELKEPHEIEDCEDGKVVILYLCNGETYTGFFEGMDGNEYIVLGALSGGDTIGLKVNTVNDYFEQVGS